MIPAALDQIRLRPLTFAAVETQTKPGRHWPRQMMQAIVDVVEDSKPHLRVLLSVAWQAATRASPTASLPVAEVL